MPVYKLYFLLRCLSLGYSGLHIQLWSQENDVTFGNEDTAQESSTGGQDGEDLHSHHVFPFSAEVGWDEGDPNTAEDQHAECDVLSFIERVWKFLG